MDKDFVQQDVGTFNVFPYHEQGVFILTYTTEWLTAALNCPNSLNIFYQFCNRWWNLNSLYEPESKSQSIEWRDPMSSKVEKFKL